MIATWEQRAAEAIRRGEQWASNLEANAEAASLDGQPDLAHRLLARARDIRDLLAILNGDEDTYIQGRLQRLAEETS